jgi:hypothetical protein
MPRQGRRPKVPPPALPPGEGLAWAAWAASGTEHNTGAGGNTFLSSQRERYAQFELKQKEAEQEEVQLAIAATGAEETPANTLNSFGQGQAKLFQKFEREQAEREQKEQLMLFDKFERQKTERDEKEQLMALEKFEREKGERDEKEQHFLFLLMALEKFEREKTERHENEQLPPLEKFECEQAECDEKEQVMADEEFEPWHTERELMQLEESERQIERQGGPENSPEQEGRSDQNVDPQSRHSGARKHIVLDEMD